MSVLPSALFVGLLASVGSVFGEPVQESTSSRSPAPNQGNQMVQQQGQHQGNQSSRNQSMQQGQSQNQGSQSAQGQDNQSGGDNLTTNAAGASVPRDTTVSGARGMIVECRPSAVNCPVEESSGSSVTTTDSLPLGSTIHRGVGETVDESSYPTSPGTGNLGSGSTGAPPGPRPGPALGIGRGGEG